MNFKGTQCEPWQDRQPLSFDLCSRAEFLSLTEHYSWAFVIGSPFEFHLFSIPPSLPPAATSLFCVYELLFPFVLFLDPHRSDIIWYLSFSV